MGAKTYRQIRSGSPNTRQKYDVGCYGKPTNSAHLVTWGNQWFGKGTDLLSATYLPHIVKHTARAPQPYTGTTLHWRNGSNYQVSTVVRKWLNWYFGHTTPNLHPSGEYISAIASMPFTLRILSILTLAERRAPKDPRGVYSGTKQ